MINYRKTIIAIALLLCRTNAFSPSVSLHPSPRLQTKLESTQLMETPLQHDNNKSSLAKNKRRNLLKIGAGCIVFTLTQPKKVLAIGSRYTSEEDSGNVRFQVLTTLPKGFSPEKLSPSSTLLITVKPAVSYTDQVPKAVADASLATTGHWVPTVLRSRQLCSKLHLLENNSSGITTTLTLENVTPEAGASLNWWKGLPLIVTAKLDEDGLDSTAGPLDLVGCRILPNLVGGLEDKHVTLPLQSRGLCADLLPKRD